MKHSVKSPDDFQSGRNGSRVMFTKNGLISLGIIAAATLSSGCTGMPGYSANGGASQGTPLTAQAAQVPAGFTPDPTNPLNSGWINQGGANFRVERDIDGSLKPVRGEEPFNVLGGTNGELQDATKFMRANRITKDGYLSLNRAVAHVPVIKGQAQAKVAGLEGLREKVRTTPHATIADYEDTMSSIRKACRQVNDPED